MVDDARVNVMDEPTAMATEYACGEEFRQRCRIVEERIDGEWRGAPQEVEEEQLPDLV